MQCRVLAAHVFYQLRLPTTISFKCSHSSYSMLSYIWLLQFVFFEQPTKEGIHLRSIAKEKEKQQTRAVQVGNKRDRVEAVFK